MCYWAGGKIRKKVQRETCGNLGKEVDEKKRRGVGWGCGPRGTVREPVLLGKGGGRGVEGRLSSSCRDDSGFTKRTWEES